MQEYAASKYDLIAYLGGKKKLAKEIIKRIPDHQLYAEPFAGSAAVFFRKARSKVEIINDINDDVYNLYRIIKLHAPEFLRIASDTPVFRVEHQKHKLGLYRDETDINRAVIFYKVLRSSFGSRINGHFTVSTDRPCRTRNEVTLKRVQGAQKRLDGVHIENLPFDMLISKYDRKHTFFYIDPPYFGSETDYGPGIFSRSDFEKLAELLSSIEGKFLLSLNDCPEVRHTFRNFKVEEVNTNYTVNSNAPCAVRELLFRNYD